MTLKPRFIKKLINLVASESELGRFCVSVGTESHIKYSLGPDGAPSSVTTEISIAWIPSKLFMWSKGSDIVALHDTKRMP